MIEQARLLYLHEVEERQHAEAAASNAESSNRELLKFVRKWRGRFDADLAYSEFCELAQEFIDAAVHVLEVES